MKLLTAGVHSSGQLLPLPVLAAFLAGVPVREGDVPGHRGDDAHSAGYHHQAIRHEQQDRHGQGLALGHPAAQYHGWAGCGGRVPQPTKGAQGQAYDGYVDVFFFVFFS